MALTLNLNRDTKQRSEPFTALECMNFVEEPKEDKPQKPCDTEAIDKILGL